MLKSYLSDEEKRKDQGLPALALAAEQTAELVELLKKRWNRSIWKIDWYFYQ